MSMQSEFVRLALRVSGMKQRYGTKEGMRKFVARKNREDQPPPLKLRVSRNISESKIDGLTVYNLRPRNKSPARHVVYLHGGAYVLGIVRPHWSFMDRLLSETPCQITVPLYGCAPEHSYREAFPFIERVYRDLLKQCPAEDIVLMGDSAGGGLALAFTQRLLKTDLPQPGGVVMLSPWLDVTMSQPEAYDIVKRDPLLDIPAAQEAGRMWAGGVDPSIPPLSPLYGPLQGLPPLFLLIGTDDILLPAARLLKERAQAEGQSLQYSEYPGMYHAWMLIPLPESQKALQEVAEFMDRSDLH